MSQRFNADPAQLYFYAFLLDESLAPQRQTVQSVGFIYWRFGYQEQEFNLEYLNNFIQQHVDPVLPLIYRVREGVESLEAKPGKATCKWCAWKFSCQESYYAARPQNTSLAQVTF